MLIGELMGFKGIERTFCEVLVTLNKQWLQDTSVG